MKYVSISVLSLMSLLSHAEDLAQPPPLWTYTKPFVSQPTASRASLDKRNLGVVIEPVMLEIPGGTLTTGCDSSTAALRADINCQAASDVIPQQNITLPAFKLASTETTVEQYMGCVNQRICKPPIWTDTAQADHAYSDLDSYKVMGDALTNPQHPIVGISWQEVHIYIQWLNQTTGKHYRLPTELEWEYAARAKQTDLSNIVGNYDTHHAADQWSYTSPVGSFAANPFGLYDMQGNVYEWVEDVYHTALHTDSNYKMARGGAWNSPVKYLLPYHRFFVHYQAHYPYLGFRLAMDL
jgi:formylglycine-generating enzyme required for sulfatase activity